MVRKDYFIPNLYGKTSYSSEDSTYDHIMSCLTPPGLIEVKKDTKTNILEDLTNMTRKIDPLPPKSV